MAFIVIDLAGKGTYGGYLKIDGGKRIKLTDDLLIYVDAGTHYLSYTSLDGLTSGVAAMNRAVGNNRTAAYHEKDAVEGEITAAFGENDMMVFTVVSDARGRVLSLPSYKIRELSDSDYQKTVDLYKNQGSSPSADGNGSEKSVLVAFLLCMFLGGVGAHQFYLGEFKRGLLYLFTFGLFGFGAIVDFFVLLVRLIKNK